VLFAHCRTQTYLHFKIEGEYKKEHMKKRKIIHHGNFDPYMEGYYEPVIGESETIVGEAYTIQELYQRAQQHLPIKERFGQYDEDPQHDDPDMNQLKDADMVDKQSVLNQTIHDDIERARNKKKSVEDAQKDQEDPENSSSSGEDAEESTPNSPN